MIALDGRPLGDGKRFIARILATGAAVRDEIIGYDRPGGERRWLNFSARLLDPADSGQQAVLASFTDVTEQHQAQLRLNHQATSRFADRLAQSGVRRRVDSCGR